MEYGDAAKWRAGWTMSFLTFPPQWIPPHDTEAMCALQQPNNTPHPAHSETAPERPALPDCGEETSSAGGSR